MSARRLGILVKRYPKLSETFILGEILGLERMGFELRIYSLCRPSDRTTHPRCAEVRAPLRYGPEGLWQALRVTVPSHLVLLGSRPWAYLRAALGVLRERSRRAQFGQAVWLARRMMQDKVSHLHAHFVSEPGAVAELAHRLSGIPFSLSAHAKDIYLSHETDLARRLGAARFTVTCTGYNLRHLKSIAPPHALVCRMYHGVELERRRVPEPRSERGTGHPALILAVGRLREKKGFHVLIEACELLRRRGLRFRCEIVGYGPQRDRLEEMVAHRGLRDHVVLRGKLDHERVLALYREASLFALPCIIAPDGDRDGIPNVILEALTMGVPVVSTWISGIPEAVRDRQTGLLVEPGRAGALADAMQRLLRDPELCRRLAQTGREDVRARFSNRINLQLLRRLLEASLGPSQRSIGQPCREVSVYD